MCDKIEVIPSFTKRVREIKLRGFDWEKWAGTAVLLSAGWDPLPDTLNELSTNIDGYLSAIAFDGGTVGETYDILGWAQFDDGRLDTAVMRVTIIPD